MNSVLLWQPFSQNILIFFHNDSFSLFETHWDLIFPPSVHLTHPLLVDPTRLGRWGVSYKHAVDVLHNELHHLWYSTIIHSFLNSFYVIIETMNKGKYSQLHLWHEVSVEAGSANNSNMPQLGCAMNRNHSFQVGYLSLHSLSRSIFVWIAFDTMDTRWIGELGQICPL